MNHLGIDHMICRSTLSGVVTVKERVQGTYRCRRIVRRTDDGKDTVEFVTNVLDPKEMSAEQVCETYRRRWTIESLFKRLKQNFPLKYFLGDNVNAIEIQIFCLFKGIFKRILINSDFYRTAIIFCIFAMN
jgi:IS4 transposase